MGNKHAEQWMRAPDQPAEQHASVLGKSADADSTLSLALQEGITVLEVRYGPDGKPVDCAAQGTDPSPERLTGFLDGTSKGRDFEPDVDGGWPLACHRVVETGEPLRLEAYNRSLDRWFLVNASRLGGPGSRLVVVVCNDVTKRVYLETERSLLNAISEDFAKLSTEDEITNAVGARLATFLGITSCSVADFADGIASVRSAFRAPGSDADRPTQLKVSDYLNEELQAAARAGETVVIRDMRTDPRVDAARYEALDVRAGIIVPFQVAGDWRHSFAVGAPTARDWRDDQIQVIKEVANRYFPRIERARIERALRDSEHRYRTVVNAQTEMLCRFTRDGTITFVNAAYARALASTPEALVGQSFWPYVQSEEREALAATLQRLTPENPEARIENHFASAEGMRWTLWNNRALAFDDRGCWLEAQSSGIDITDRKRMEEALRQADQRKDEFLAMLGHELRNPLAPMRLIFAAARRRGEKQVSGKQFDILDRQSAALSRLVDDLLDVARITRDKIELRKEVVAVGALISRAVDSVADLIETCRHQLSITQPNQALLIDVDPLRIEQVLVNLLVNAARYTKPGGHISLSAHRKDDHVEFRVKDSGVGLEPDEQESVFQLFMQAKRSPDRAPGGLGLGLTIVRRLVEMHQGRVYAESAGRGHGSEFIVELPVATIAASVSRTPGTQGSAPTGLGLRVLIVDDNVDAAESLREIVEDMGHEVHVAHDGLAAVDAARSLLPNLILLDIGLPGIDGYEAARRIRGEGRFSGLLVAVTGYGQTSDRMRAFDAGFEQHIVKPVQLDELIDTVRVAEGRLERGVSA